MSVQGVWDKPCLGNPPLRFGTNHKKFYSEKFVFSFVKKCEYVAWKALETKGFCTGRKYILLFMACVVWLQNIVRNICNFKALKKTMKALTVAIIWISSYSLRFLSSHRCHFFTNWCHEANVCLCLKQFCS